jgi:hypothetical protein
MTHAPGTTAANRQGATEWPAHADFCRTVEREAVLEDAAADPAMTAQGLVETFLTAPVYRPTAESTWGTVYTAVYDADARALTLRWPDAAWSLSLDGFTPGSLRRRTWVALPPVEHAPLPAHAQERPLLIA